MDWERAGSSPGMTSRGFARLTSASGSVLVRLGYAPGKNLAQDFHSVPAAYRPFRFQSGSRVWERVRIVVVMVALVLLKIHMPSPANTCNKSLAG